MYTFKYKAINIKAATSSNRDYIFKSRLHFQIETDNCKHTSLDVGQIIRLCPFWNIYDETYMMKCSPLLVNTLLLSTVISLRYIISFQTKQQEATMSGLVLSKRNETRKCWEGRLVLRLDSSKDEEQLMSLPSNSRLFYSRLFSLFFSFQYFMYRRVRLPCKICLL